MRRFSRLALLLCMAVYTVGMGVLIALARHDPSQVITAVRYPLTVYALIVVTCLGCMLSFSQRVSGRR